MKPEIEHRTITAQIPEALLRTLRSIAQAEGRSLSSQIRLFLSQSVTRKTRLRPPNYEHR